MRIYGQPLTSGSDEYLNELALEYTEDPDAMSAAAMPTLVTRESLALTEASLEATADLARTTACTPDDGPAPAPGLFPTLHPKALLKWRG